MQRAVEVLRQQVAHIGHRFGRCRLAPRYAEADLEHARRLEHAGLDHLLGEQIAGAGYNGTFEQGSAIVPMNLDASPQGIYYVRIQTANNETETLKLVKE